MTKTRQSRVIWLRRVVQTASLILFLYLFIQTAYHPINAVGGSVTFFFNLDPLVLLTVWIAAHAAASALLLSLLTLGVTLLFGRWFCGWICPLGSLHNLFAAMRGGRVKEKLEAGGYSRWQLSKYYLLVFFLCAAIAGANVAGWLDPFSFLYRSLATAVFPALNLGVQRLFGSIYQADPGIGRIRLTAVTEPVYEILRRYFLALEQPHYFWSLMIGLMFAAVLTLNFFRARFWCRYICPLGALLGLVGKNPLVRLATDAAACNDCRLCLSECQGGANPQARESWRPSECFYCWNCESSCPAGAVKFRFEIPEAGKS